MLCVEKARVGHQIHIGMTSLGGVDRVVTATCRQGALRDYHIGPLELQEDGQTGGIWVGVTGHGSRGMSRRARGGQAGGGQAMTIPAHEGARGMGRYGGRVVRWYLRRVLFQLGWWSNEEKEAP